MTKGIMKPKTDKDILNEYEMKYTRVMEVFSVSRDMAFRYLKGEGRPDEQRLRDVITEYDGHPEADMAREMLRLRGFVLVADVEEAIS